MKQKTLPGITEIVEKPPKEKKRIPKKKDFVGIEIESVRKMKFPVYMVLIPQHAGKIGFMMIDPESSLRFTVKSPKGGWQINDINPSQLIHLKKSVEEMFESDSEVDNLPYCNVLRRYDEGYVIYASAPIYNHTEECEKLKIIYMYQVPGFPRSQRINESSVWVKVDRNGGTNKQKAARFKALKSFRKYNREEEMMILEMRENTQVSLHLQKSNY